MKKKQLKKEIQLQIGRDIYFKGTMGQLYLATAGVSCGLAGTGAAMVFALIKGLGV